MTDQWIPSLPFDTRDAIVGFDDLAGQLVGLNLQYIGSRISKLLIRATMLKPGIDTIESGVRRIVLDNVRDDTNPHGEGWRPNGEVTLQIPHQRYRMLEQQTLSCQLSLYTAPMIKFLSVLITLPLLGASPDAAIRQVLDDQVSAWNRGDIPTFMNGYDKSDSTTFVGKTVTKGHAQVLDRYLKTYSTPAKMGTLKFSNIEIRPLGSDYAAVIGNFHLDRSPEGGGEASGIFTLVFHKTAQGWKIIIDHTS